MEVPCQMLFGKNKVPSIDFKIIIIWEPLNQMISMIHPGFKIKICINYLPKLRMRKKSGGKHPALLEHFELQVRQCVVQFPCVLSFNSHHRSLNKESLTSLCRWWTEAQKDAITCPRSQCWQQNLDSWPQLYTISCTPTGSWGSSLSSQASEFEFLGTHCRGDFGQKRLPNLE